MKAVGYQKTLPIEDPASLQEVELREPVASGRDLLVEVKAISVNPVDVKIRAGRTPPAGEWGVLGWDAAGIVRAVGPQVSLFRPGDRVWYAGDITRAGSNAELQAVDERIVGHLPCTLDFAQAAALPLTAITAWEMLFDRLRIAPGKRPTDERLLIVGAGGGVGSILVQLARRLTGLTVIGTASRAETQSWVRELGAHHVLDHSRPLADELKRIGFADVSHVVSLTHSEEHFAQIVEVLAPQGCFGLIDDPATPLDVRKLKAKSVSLHWELMFTRSLFQTADMIAQHRLLCELAALVDAGLVRTTLGEHYGRIDAANLRRAHALIEAGKARGKIVLEAF
ncbi:MAG TPA: zinc-binding alcohol dehydrogenase family protein [Accumulibacter sp.]|uniref:zinc-binding alcohol dehydrogenase family protein n=1 Tax=Accumulibacter sp. TaxID=2053492 RepID=UPI002C868EB4|nr:zinc-binding alcohol dehydrogenase family protein [Accumulibacter sp.]HMV05406.1 zinc-binding alcohol dehydrogenase family protein [Accumulibacter sp.]HMX68145.1 zinc-binding alcohol dehydrogenase family protein [Accumulibacter sp.]HNE39948.1 zinc-binding alcohol dehydrogenase family protein [Accumulibacter sp.]HNG86255.1 zinc-binding alcohol dehydrogenase family protein [Accumulibacter sp.]HNH92309.1 zinc-binding alcohol dehydrogenase family protein [Accumulibacter sp.]